MKINRQKMETEKWAVRRWKELGESAYHYANEYRFAHPDFKGEDASRIKRFIIQKDIDRIARKIRQVEIILKKIGYLSV